MNLVKKLRHWIQTGECQVWLEYALLSLIILFPLLASGYVLTLDLVFTPHQAWPTELTNTYPLQVLLWVLYHVFPGDIVEKIVLFAILLLSGVGMHLLFRYVIQGMVSESGNVAAYFAGMLYVINPFVYARFMAGQWMVLLGYALLPFFIRAFLRLINDSSWRQTLIVAMWAFAITSVSLHHSGMAALLGALVLVVGSWQLRRSKRQRVRLWRSAMVATAIWGVVSSFWLAPTVLGETSIARSVDEFDSSHFAAFATQGSNVVGMIGNVVRLQGFWAESQQLFILPQQFVPLWGVVVLIMWILIGGGVVQAWRSYRVIALFGGVSITLGVVLAATPLLYWIGTIVPFANGYREPHKFVNLVVMGYALFGAFGVIYIREKWRGSAAAKTVLTTTALLLPIAVTPVMLGGFAGQLVPRAYPPGWQEANVYIAGHIGGGRALFLPWHQYANYRFSGRTIANPAAKYFTFPIVQSDDPEFKNIPPTTPNNETRIIGALLKNDQARLVDYLYAHDIRYVLLAKEQEFQDYVFLNGNDYAEVVENESIKVYEVRR